MSVKFDGSPQRIEIPNYPKLALREVILNAVIHRDYMPASNVKLEFFDDRFEITSPGTLLKGLSLNEILSGASKLRNPSIAKVFEILEYIEAYGTGFKKIFDLYKKFNMRPEIVVLPNFFRVVMPNIKYNDVKNIGLNVPANVPANVPVNVPVNVPANLNATEIKILELINSNPNITQKELAQKVNLTEKTIKRNTNKLKEKGILERVGADKNGYWKIRNGQ